MLLFKPGACSASSFTMKRKIADFVYVVAMKDLVMNSLSFYELYITKLLLWERGSAVRETFESAAVFQGFKVFPIWESVDSQALISAVKSGFWPICASLSIGQEDFEGKKFCLTIGNWKWHYGACSKEPLSITNVIWFLCMMPLLSWKWQDYLKVF